MLSGEKADICDIFGAPFSSIKNRPLAWLVAEEKASASNPEAVSQQFSVQVLIDSGAITEHTLR